MEKSYLRDFVPGRESSRVRFASGSPCVLFPRRLRQLVYHYVRLDTEFAWLGTVEEIAEHQFLLTDFVPTPQEASRVHVKLKPGGQLDLLERWGAEGELGDRKIETLRFWGQSHHSFGVTPSNVDNTTFDQFRAQNLPWFIQGIFNNRGEANFKLFLHGGKIVVENALWIPVDDVLPDLQALALAQIADNLTVVDPPVEEPMQPEDFQAVAKGEVTHG